MAQDYREFSSAIIKLLGGRKNISNVFHCATRLRFTLNDISIAESSIKEIKSRKEVLDVIVQNGQFQIVIGPNVNKVFAVVSEDLNLLENSVENNDEEVKKSSMDKFFAVVSGIFTPIVPVLMASGMMGAVITIAKLLGVPETNSTLYLFNIVYEAGFYFLPFFIAATSAKAFKSNQFLSMLVAAIMLWPGFTDFTSNGVKTLEFFSINVQAVDYQKAVLPIILGVWLLSYLEKFFNRVLPDIIRAFMAPLLVMAIMLPIQLIIIGPLGTNIANILGTGVMWLGENLGFFAVALLAFFTPVMIATGTHSFAFPVIVATLTTVGYDQLLMPSMVAENLSMAGAAFALALLSDDKERRAQGISASLSAVLGISEPAMYGFNLPSKYGFLGSMIGGAIGGLFAGIFKFRMYVIASSSVVGIPAMFGDKGVENVIIGIFTIIISFISSAIITMMLSKSNLKLDIFSRKGSKNE